MNIRKKVFTLCSLLCVSAALLVAAPNAERLFGEVQNLDYEKQSLESIISAYDKLDDGIARDAQQARKDMLAARDKGDLSSYKEAYARLENLKNLRMKGEQSNVLLGRIMAEAEPKRSEYASWLYRKSDSYRPMLTLDFSAQGEGYSYHYRQQIQKSPESDIVLPDHTQIRVNSSQVGILKGWGLVEGELTYHAGETIPMPYTNQTLYAVWEPGVRFLGAERDTFYEGVSPGSEVVVPTASTSDEGAIFAGWYDRGSHTLLRDTQSYTVQGKGALFEPLWKSVGIVDVAPLYYSREALPKRTQLGVGFILQNKGNVDLRRLQATLSSESPYVAFLVDTVNLANLPASRYLSHNSRFATTVAPSIRGGANTFRFVISDNAPENEELPFTLTLTDSQGDSWSLPLSWKVE